MDAEAKWTPSAKDTGPVRPRPWSTNDDSELIKVDHPEQFPLGPAGDHMDAPELNVTGTVTPDVSRNVPVISLASGRVVEIHARSAMT